MVEQDKQEAQADKDRKEFDRVRMDFMKHLYLVSSAMMIFVGAILSRAPQGQQWLLKFCAVFFFLSIVSATVMLWVISANYGRPSERLPLDEYKVKRRAFAFSIVFFALGAATFLCALFFYG